jgi:ribonuclease HI
VVKPRTNSITHIDNKSQSERHTINRTELAAIAVALKSENIEKHMSILTDSSFCTNTIRNYTIDPAAYNQHLHKDLLQLTNQLLKEMDRKQLKTHIGKVTSHTDVEYNEPADKAARAVVDGEHTPDTTFEEADPPIRGLRTWSHIRHNPTNNPEHIRNLTNFKACIKRT